MISIFVSNTFYSTIEKQFSTKNIHFFFDFRLQWQRDAYSFNDFIMPKVLSGFPLTLRPCLAFVQLVKLKRPHGELEILLMCLIILNKSGLESKYILILLPFFKHSKYAHCAHRSSSSISLLTIFLKFRLLYSQKFLVREIIFN